MVFNNREAAAKLLLEKLSNYRDRKPLVLGIPRGAMPMAKVIADGLGGELGVILVHKISHPVSKEFAIGCIGLSGHIHRMPYAGEIGIPESCIQNAAQEQLAVLRRRKKQYALPDYKYKDRTVVVVDDGIATGATTICAIHEVRGHQPKEIVLTAAVAAADTAEKIRPLVDNLVLLSAPKNFYAVGEYFLEFPQVTDEQVMEILHGSESGKTRQGA